MANTSAASSSGPRLLVGVLSYPSPAALVRRSWQRSLCNASGPGVSLRFVMGAADEDVNRSDVLLFDVARNDRLMGTYLLTNRFFRWAITQSDAAFIARADDDTVFDAGAISHLLLAPEAHMPWNHAAHVVFGPFGEWYMWNREAMQPSCFAYFSFRWAKAKEAAAMHAANASSRPLARWQHECVAPGVVGPFPYAKGPFVAYSRAVAAALVPALEVRHSHCDDARTQPRHRSQRRPASVYVSREAHPPLPLLTLCVGRRARGTRAWWPADGRRVRHAA